ncbi:hypothetical protein X943_002072 [Babesia divergens]|uniref:Uncharacterized protein n=1 Tax=Babesia divergens TaxID=32595 RepID=A0AAD9GD64_BABDI|nr:hypothetical protein X943_002072 [Babesia divergens]
MEVQIQRISHHGTYGIALRELGNIPSDGVDKEGHSKPGVYPEEHNHYQNWQPRPCSAGREA